MRHASHTSRSEELTDIGRLFWLRTKKQLARMDDLDNYATVLVRAW
jgi:hypothetical protein